MKKDQLIDAIGLLDDAVLAETDGGGADGTELGTAVVTASDNKATIKRRFRIILVTTVILALIGGTAAVASGGIGGFLNLGNRIKIENGGELLQHEYVAYGDARVRTSSIRGAVNKDMKTMPKTMKDRPLWSNTSPNTVVKRYEDIEDAIDYIGYSKLVFPKTDYPFTHIYTEVTGFQKEDSSEFKPGVICFGATQRYHSNPEYWFSTSIYIYTDSWPMGNVGIHTAVTDQATYTSEERRVNGRTFCIVLQEDPSYSEGHQLSTGIFWQENGVFYYFHIVYPEELREEAEKVAQEWMESFP